jgi:hypothetical protein
MEKLEKEGSNSLLALYIKDFYTQLDAWKVLLNHSWNKNNLLWIKNSVINSIFLCNNVIGDHGKKTLILDLDETLVHSC